MTKFNCSLIFFHCNLYPFVTFSSSSSQELNVSLEYINLEEKFVLKEEKNRGTVKMCLKFERNQFYKEAIQKNDS